MESFNSEEESSPSSNTVAIPHLSNDPLASEESTILDNVDVVLRNLLRQCDVSMDMIAKVDITPERTFIYLQPSYWMLWENAPEERRRQQVTPPTRYNNSLILSNRRLDTVYNRNTFEPVLLRARPGETGPDIYPLIEVFVFTPATRNDAGGINNIEISLTYVETLNDLPEGRVLSFSL